MRIGDRLLERYIVEERLASGGHSVVYRGTDERLQRPVCIKVFRRLKSDDGAYKTAYEHFVQEAFALSKLTHPNTLRIYDFGYLDELHRNSEGYSQSGAPFQVSEFMPSGTLWTQVRNSGPLPAAEAASIVRALGGALGEAHRCDIIHRDIKPQNILFGEVGRNRVPKLADFGIAKELATATSPLPNRAGDTGLVVGRPFLMYSPWWAAPEQLTSMTVERTADVYSLTLSIVFMLTGRVVFRENDPVRAYEQRKIGTELVQKACEGRDISRDIVEQLTAACVFAPDYRPSDVEEFTGKLANALTSGKRTTQPVPIPIATPAASSPVPPQAPSAVRPPAASSPVPAPVPAPFATPAPSKTTPYLTAVPRENARPAPAPARASIPPKRLHVSPSPQNIAARSVHFIATSGDSVDRDFAGGKARIRLAFVPIQQGFCLHVRGLNCFVGRAPNRPSRAVEYTGDGELYMLSPNRQSLGYAAVYLGKAAAGHRLFPVDDMTVAIGTDECPIVAALDFGRGNDFSFIYQAQSYTHPH